MEEPARGGEDPTDKVGTNDDGEQELTEPLISDGQFPNDNDIVKRVAGSKTGIGFFGYRLLPGEQGPDLKADRDREPRRPGSA